MVKGAKTDVNVAKKPTTTVLPNAAPAVAVTRPRGNSLQGNSPSHRLGLFDQLSIAWLVIAFTVYAGFNGVWLHHHKEIATAKALPDSFHDFHALFQSAWKHENAFSAVADTSVSLIKSVWKANALTDRRLATSDLTHQAVSGIALYFLAPAFLILAYGIAHNRRWRYSVQLVSTTVALASLAFYFLTEYYNGFANISTKGDQHLGFLATHLAFTIPNFFLWIQAFFGSHSGTPYPRNHRISFTVKFFVGSLVAGTVILLAASIGHHYFDSKEVRAALKSGLEYSQVYANQAYESASAAAAEAAHQAHILAAPYIDQAAEFVHDNLGSK